jgi:hypothetical protein
MTDGELEQGRALSQEPDDAELRGDAIPPVPVEHDLVQLGLRALAVAAGSVRPGHAGGTGTCQTVIGGPVLTLVMASSGSAG